MSAWLTTGLRGTRTGAVAFARAIGISATILAVLALSACGSTDSASRAPVASDVVNLVAAESVSPAEQEVVRAQSVLVSKCMSAKGFATPVLPVSPVNLGAQVSPLLAHGGTVVSVPSEPSAIRAAREFGFGIAESLQVAERQRQVSAATPATGSSSNDPERYSSADKPGYTAALEGPSGQNGTFTVPGIARHGYPTKGCVANAASTLYGNALLWVEATYLPEDLNLVVTQNVHTNPEFISASKRWASCFAKATARQVQSPDLVVTSLVRPPAGQRPVAPPHAVESALAVADTHCQYSSGFVQRSVALRRKYATEQAGPYEGLLLTLVEARSLARRKAEAVLAAAGR